MTKIDVPNIQFDFRSDTVTQPNNEMLEAMFKARVGDDVFQEDPTINELEEKAATLFGHEAGLFCSSGTQTNQIAIQIHCKPGDEVICAKDAHIYKYEGGGIARNAGASVHLIVGDRGRINHQEVESAIHEDNVHYPISTLVALEDTMNRGGGAIYDFDEIKRIRKVCLEHHIPLHVDGARIFNTLVATQRDAKEYGQQFDSISICLSKGLGAPVGSVLLGSKSFIHQARRVRKVMGGGMRQAGFLAAAGIYALDHNIERLADDHRRAKRLGDAMQKMPFISNVMPVETNLVICSTADEKTLSRLLDHCRANQLDVIEFSPTSFRLVTHMHISDASIDRALEIIGSFSA